MAEIDQIVEENFALMISNEPGGMVSLGWSESMGGNAGCEDGVSCWAANFYYDALSGKILYFGNCQDVPDGIKRNNSGAFFRIKGFPISGEIIGVHGVPEEHKFARNILYASVTRFNQKSDPQRS